ncbi:hypothetical protein [Streptomyces sp. NPDC002328]|uniref:hypothetical protein n=1 Tax=Streptomyces sp. NPDC002328 TaxID=3364642 RepID=UPI00367ACBDD
MNLARCLTMIDLLCTRDFPAQHGRTDVGTGGPGYLMAALRTSDGFWEDDGTRREETEEQFEADRDGLTERLADRWGPPHRVSLASTLERSMSDDEDIPEPWASLSGHVPDVHLWQSPDTARWIALGVSQWDRELPFQLLVLVTVIDPP